MHFPDDALFPENQQKLVITAAPYAPMWLPSDFPSDIPVSMEAQIQKAVDCYNAGATVLHIHVREENGTSSKRLSRFNEFLAGVRDAVPEMVLQVGGSISFAPETAGEAARFLSDDTRHMLAELKPTPDQVTVAVNSGQLNLTELMEPDEIEGTSMADPAMYESYREMTVPAGPSWVEEHVKRLCANGIQPHFVLTNLSQLETLERMMRRGKYRGPLGLTWIAAGGGAEGPNPYMMMNFVRQAPDGAVLTLSSTGRRALPLNILAIVLGLQVRCGIEDNMRHQNRSDRMSTVDQIDQLVRVSREFGRDIATAPEAREIYHIGESHQSIEETLTRNGFTPNRQAGQRGVPLRLVG